MKLDITLGDLTKIGKSQKFTLSVDVEGGKLVVLKKQKDSQEDWNTFTHDKSKSQEPSLGAAPGPYSPCTQGPAAALWALLLPRTSLFLWGVQCAGAAL